MWSKALVSSPPGSWHWSLGECSRSLMIWNRCCTRYNLCTCHKLDLDSWIPSPTAGCTLIPWSQVTSIRTSQVSPWIVKLAPISWRTHLPGPFCVQDMVHLATGMIVGLHVISEGAILTNYLTDPWSPREKSNVFLATDPPLIGFRLSFYLFCTSFFFH